MFPDLKIFGDRLRQLRQQRGLTQAELARLLPVSEGLISRWERAYQGQKRVWKPDRQMFLRLIEVFAEGLDPVAAQVWGTLVGYKLTQAELRLLFPSMSPAAHGSDHSTGLWNSLADTWRGYDAPLQDLSTGGLADRLPTAVQEVFVDRVEELARLRDFLAEMLAGQGRVVFISGAAGSGKSSLMRVFAQDALAEHPDLVVLVGSCNAYGGYGTPYMPFRELLGILLGDSMTHWADGTIQHNQHARLLQLATYAIQLLLNRCCDLVETFVPISALKHHLKSLQLNSGVSPDQQQSYLAAIEIAAARPDSEQRDLFGQYMTLLHLLSQRRPLLLIIDDLHWADAASVSLLFHLGRHLLGKRILIAGTYRTSDLTLRHQDASHSLVPVIHEMQRLYGSILVDLDHTMDESFVDAYLGSEPNRLGAAFRARLLQHTRGHALFTVEMVRGMQVRGELVKDADNLWTEGNLNWEKLPERVEGLIAELMDRLPAHLRELLEVASIQGETFIAEVIAQALLLDEHELLQYLTADLGKSHHLVVEQGVLRIGSQRFSQFRFRHVLFQTYLYRSLGEVKRNYLHEIVGSKLEALCGGDAEPFIGQLARHFQEADIPDKAVLYLLQSGKQAMRLAAHAESINTLKKGLELLDRMPASTMRDRMELDMLVTLGTSLIATRGFSVVEVGEVYARALSLSVLTNNVSLRAAILFNLWIFYRTRANHVTASDTAQQLMELAEQTQDTALLLQAHHALWTNSLYEGNFSAAHMHAEQGLALYKAEDHHPLTFQYGGHDPGVCCHIFGAYALWYLGYPDQSLQRIRAGIALARELDHAYSLAMALTLGAEIYLLRREGEAALALLQEAWPLADSHSFANWLELGTIFHGWALVELDEVESGIEKMLRGLEVNRATVGEETGLHCFAQLASAYGKAGLPEKGLALLDAALAVEDKNKLRHWDQWQPELFRLQGELKLIQAGKISPAQEDVQAAEFSFHRAIAIARQQNAKLLELRAVVSLSRLWALQGQLERAYALDKETYAWFTEGFETRDLQEANVLLNWLNQEIAHNETNQTKC
jgi:transcriptional regulator with XRE-family HTH domain